MVGSGKAPTTTLTFTQVAGGAVPAAQTIAVSGSPGPLNFTATTTTQTGANWLSVTPTSGTTPASVQVVVNGTTLVTQSAWNEELDAKHARVVEFLRARTQLPIVGVGGIADAKSAREKFAAGAQLIQVYTGFVYRGPSLVAECADALARAQHDV